MSEGPTILWGLLKDKKVKSNDGNDLGKIEKISQNYIRLEKGRVKKEKFWLPKYYAEAFDGRVLWLMEGEEKLRSTYHYGKEPPSEQFQQDFDSYKRSYGEKKDWNLDKIGIVKERKRGVPSKPKKTGTGYKNIRDLK